MCKSTMQFIRFLAKKLSVKKGFILITTVGLAIYMPSVEIEHFNLVVNL